MRCPRIFDLTPDQASPSPPRLPGGLQDATVADLMDLLGRTHTLAILYAFSRNPGPWRFTELEKGLDLPPNTLTTRLKELVAAGLIDRQSYDEIPPRVEYTGTDRVEALKPAFTALYQWASSHGLDAGRTW